MISPEPWIEHLVEHLPAAHEGTGSAGVHQVRVAAGRLSVWLALGGRTILRDDLRWLRSALGPVRDLDVLIAKHPDATWARGLAAERAARHAELVEALDEPRLGGLIAALRLSKPIAHDRARKGLARIRKRVAVASGKLELDERDVDALHGLRRKLRHLRYAHEWLGEREPGLVDLQDALGELNNLVVALDHLERAGLRTGRAPEVEAERAALAGALEAQRESALATWRKTTPKFAATA